MTEDLYKAFELLLFGWGGVFVVILIIYLASLLLTKTFPIKNKEGLLCTYLNSFGYLKNIKQ
ncbi:hypothetical protein I8F94_03070 [Enterococcus gallinarum]|nr:hypothetical protein [Enterococcus gallinarum]